MTWGSFGVKLINNLVILPFILSHFLQSEVAVWLLFLMIIGLVTLCDFGFAGSFSRAISYAMGGAKTLDYVFKKNNTAGENNPNWKLIGKIYKAMGHVYIYISGIAFVVILVGGTFFIYKPINAIPNNHPYWVAWVIIVISTPVVIYGIKYSTYLIGVNKIAFVKRLDMIFSMASVVCSVIIIVYFKSILWIIVNNQFWMTVNVFRDYQVVKRDKNLMNNLDVSAEKDTYNIIWNSSWRTALGLISSYGITQFTAIYYAQLGNSAMVASYLLSLKIITTVVDFSRAPFYSKIPVLSLLRAQGRDKELIDMAKKGMIITIGVFTVIVIGVGFFHAPILKLIHSKTSFVSNEVWALMCLAFLFERYGSLHIQLYSLTNHVIMHTSNIITGIIVCICIIAGASRLGIYIYPLSMIVANGLFYSWFTAMHSYKEFKMSFFKFERFILLIPGATLILYCIFVFFYK